MARACSYRSDAGLDATIVDIPGPPGTRAALVQLSSNSGLAVIEPLDGHTPVGDSNARSRPHRPPGVRRGHARRSGHPPAPVRQRGASDGAVYDYGPFISVGFTDPDGMRTEAVWVRDPSMIGATHRP